MLFTKLPLTYSPNTKVAKFFLFQILLQGRNSIFTEVIASFFACIVILFSIQLEINNYTLIIMQDMSSIYQDFGLSQSLDFIVALAIETKSDPELFKLNYHKVFINAHMDQMLKNCAHDIDSVANACFIDKNAIDYIARDPSFPTTVALDWCLFNVKESKVIKTERILIQKKEEPQEELPDGSSAIILSSLHLAISSIYSYVSEIESSKQIKYVTLGDWVVNYQFQVEALKANFKLPEDLLSKTTNIFQILFQKDGIDGLAQGLTTLFKEKIGLTLNSSDTCNAIINLFSERSQKMRKASDHSLIRQQPVLRKQYSPTMGIEADHSPARENGTEKAPAQKERSRSREREIVNRRQADEQPENVALQTIGKIFKLTWCPNEERKEIIGELDFFKAFKEDIKINDISFGEEGENSFCIVELLEPADMNQLLENDTIKGFKVTVTQSSEAELQQAANKKNASPKNKYINMQPTHYSALKMRGLPFKGKNEDVMTFFSGYDYFEDSIKIGKNSEGTKTGEGAILFKSENESKRAFLERQGHNIGHRWIELQQMTFQDYQLFDQSQVQNRTVKLNKYITESNRTRVMKLRGLPFSATQELICEFFSDYNITKSDVVIEENYGKKTGFALVFFPNEDIAQLAKKDKNKKTIGSRYVEILDCTLQDIQ